MRKFFIILFFLLLLGAMGFGVYTVFYSYEFPGILLNKWLKTYHPEVELETFEYTKRQLNPWDLIVFEGVKLVFVKDKITHQYDLASLILRSDKAFWERDKKLSIMAEDVGISIDKLSAKDLKVNFIADVSDNIITSIQGSIKAASVDWSVFHIKEILSLIEGNGNEIHLSGFFCKGYDGELSGEIVFKNFPRLSYDVNLELSQIDSKALEEINEGMFSQINGELSGAIQFTGQATAINKLTSDINIRSGGTIKASLLGLIVNYIPTSTQKDEIKQLIKDHGEIPLEKGVIHLDSVSDDALSAKIDVQSRKLNLNVGITVDINLDIPLSKVIEKFH